MTVVRKLYLGRNRVAADWRTYSRNAEDRAEQAKKGLRDMRDRLLRIENSYESLKGHVRAWTAWAEHHCASCPLELGYGVKSDGSATNLHTEGEPSAVSSDS